MRVLAVLVCCALLSTVLLPAGMGEPVADDGTEGETRVTRHTPAGNLTVHETDAASATVDPASGLDAQARARLSVRAADREATAEANRSVHAGPGSDIPPIPDPSNPLDWAEVTLDTPIGGREVSGVVTLQGTARAQAGYEATSVDVRVDGHFLGTAHGVENWTFPLDTRRLVDGPHELSVIVWARPAAIPGWILKGEGEYAQFRSANNVSGVVLLDVDVNLSGVHAEPWVFQVEENYTGLRVRLDFTGNESSPAPSHAEMVVAYAGDPETCAGGNGTCSGAGARAWARTYGILSATAQVVRPPYGVIAAPGVLTLEALLAGWEGHARLRVEALPAPHP